MNPLETNDHKRHVQEVTHCAKVCKRPNKKRKTNPKIPKVMQILLLSDPKNVSKNCIWMNEQEIKKFRPLNSSTQDKYVEMGTRVFKIAIARCLVPGKIFLNPLQYPG